MTPIIVKTFMFMLRLPQSRNQKTLNVTKRRWQARKLLMSLRMTLKNLILLENYWRLGDLEALHRSRYSRTEIMETESRPNF